MNHIKTFPTKPVFKSTEQKLQSLASKIKDPIARKELKKFIKSWAQNLPGKEALEIICEQVK